tara:strand:+ start:954 stop:1415 length:462 start_codon:yes stop_codon:yes gene_type:complete
MCIEMSDIVLVTGGFDPIHSGHITYLEEASRLGKKLVVGLNSDEWLIRKKGKFFLPFEERKSVLDSIRYVDEVMSFNDDDDTANNAIYKLIKQTNIKVIFANGGDRTDKNIPEYKVYGNTPWVQFVFGVGGSDKKNSSSKILANWQNNCVQTK